jgi:hypothetical protein
MEETGTHGCVTCFGPASELVARKVFPLAVCKSLAVGSSFLDRNEDLLESALAVLLATINMLRFVNLDMASASDVLSWLDTRAAALGPKRDVLESQG